MKDNELLEITGSGLDQPIPIELKILDKVDEIIAQAIQAENVGIALDEAKHALSMTRISGLCLAKLLYFIGKNWNKFYIDDDRMDYLQNELGLTAITITRYERVWSLFQNHIAPLELENSLMSRPMRDLVSIANAVAQEYELTEENWESLANAPDSSTVNETLRNIKGQEPRSNALVLKLKRSGDIICWSNGSQYFIGYLELSSEEPVVQAAVDRILSASGILKE